MGGGRFIMGLLPYHYPPWYKCDRAQGTAPSELTIHSPAAIICAIVHSPDLDGAFAHADRIVCMPKGRVPWAGYSQVG
jgi:hypothetical protein